MTPIPPPPRAGTDADRRALTALFARTGFTETTVLERLGLSTLDALEGEARQGALAHFADTDDSALLLRLFVLGARLDRAVLDAAIGAAASTALETTSLIAPEAGGEQAGSVAATVQLIPVSANGRAVIVASDRREDPDGLKTEVFPDLVYSGHNLGTLHFLRFMPHTATGAVLDLCSGTAVIGLAAASHATRVVSVDITDRSTAFGEFNRWLNDGTNVEVRSGDLFEPVRGERFARILAHPPYVPSRTALAIYRDGGETGDRLLRRIIAELPDYLERGGTFHIVTLGMDTEQAPFESRVRDWLGEAGAEFDLVFGMTSSLSPSQFARKLATRVSTAAANEYELWMDVFNGLSAREIVYGGLVGRRFDPNAGAPETRRVMAEPTSEAGAYAWLFDWFDWLRLPDRTARLLASRPALAGDTVVEVTHRVEDGHFVPQRHRLKNGQRPFPAEIETDGWAVRLINNFDGHQTAAAVYDAAREVAAVPEQFDREEFCALLSLFVERGLMTLGPHGGAP